MSTCFQQNITSEENQPQNIDPKSEDISVRRYEAIIVLGPSSSGKTTLCDALAEELCVPNTRYIKEIARTVMKTQGFSRKDTSSFDMQAAIMSAQAKAEAALVNKIHSKRTHNTTDGELELRISFTPSNLVPIDLGIEEEEDDFEEEYERHR